MNASEERFSHGEDMRGKQWHMLHLRSTDDRIDGAGPDHSDGQLQHASPLRVDVRHRFRGTARTLAQSECGNDMHPLSKPRCIS